MKSAAFREASDPIRLPTARRRRGAPDARKSPSGGQPRSVFVGRERELERFRHATDTVRLFVIYGLPGIGKSEMLARAGAELVERRNARLERVGGASCRELDRVLTKLENDAERDPLVVLVDDAHRLPAGAIERIASLVRDSGFVWFGLASRVSFALSPATTEHLAIKLGALDESEARALWVELEALYGPPAQTFETFYSSQPLSPALVKHAFSDPLLVPAADPFGFTELDSDALALLKELACYDEPVVMATSPAIFDLARRFFVEAVPLGRVAVSAPVRKALWSSTHAPGAREHARCLAHYRARASLGEEVDLEVLQHAVLAGDTEVARGILLEYANYSRTLLPVRPEIENRLARAIDDLARLEEPPLPIRLLRARIATRDGCTPPRTRSLTTGIDASSFEASPEIDVVLGHWALSVGRVSEAIERASRAIVAPTLSAATRGAAAGVLADALRIQGRLAEAEHTLTTHAGAFAATPRGLALRAFVEGFVAYEAGRYLDSLRAISNAEALYRRAEAASPLLGFLERRAAAAAGRAPSRTLEPEPNAEMPFARYAARILRAEELTYSGRAIEALELAEAALSGASARGFPTLERWAAWLVGENLRVLGRLEQARAVLEPAHDRAVAASNDTVALRLRLAIAHTWLAEGRADRARELLSGPVGEARAIEARRAAVQARAFAMSGQADSAVECCAPWSDLEGYDAAMVCLARIVAWLEAGALREAERAGVALRESACRSGFHEIATHAGLCAAEALLRRGDVDAASSYIERAKADACARGYACEITIADLLDGVLARARGRFDEARRLAESARERARSHGFSVEAGAAELLLESLAGRAGSSGHAGHRWANRLGVAAPVDCRLVRPHGVLWLSSARLDELDFGASDLVVDLVTPRIIVAGRAVDFGKRPQLLAALEVLAERPGEIVSAEQLVRGTWNADYHPIRHHSRLTMAISRLRALLGSERIMSQRDGYVLATRGPWVVVRRVREGEIFRGVRVRARARARARGGSVWPAVAGSRESAALRAPEREGTMRARNGFRPEIWLVLGLIGVAIACAAAEGSDEAHKTFPDAGGDSTTGGKGGPTGTDAKAGTGGINTSFDANSELPPIETCAELVGDLNSIGCEFWAVDLDQAVNAPSSLEFNSPDKCVDWQFRKGVSVCADPTTGKVAGVCPYDSDCSEAGPSFACSKHDLCVLDPQGEPFAIAIANPHPTKTAIVELSDGTGLEKSISVAAASVVSVVPSQLGFSDHSVDHSSVAKSAYRLVADRPVAAYQFNPLLGLNVFSADASLLLPKASLDVDYTIVTHPSANLGGGMTNWNGYFSVVATEPGTTHVDITTTGKVRAGAGVPAMPANTTKSFDLTQYQVLTLEGGPDADLTGSRVHADKSVAVFSGHEAAMIHGGNPFTSPCCADHLEDQLPPDSVWGTEYLVVRSQRHAEYYPDRAKIVAQKDNTVVTIGPSGQTCYLAAGKSCEAIVDQHLSITSNAPTMVMHILASGGGIAPNRGDPAISFVPPVVQYRSSYTLIAPEYPVNHMSVVTPSDGKVELDGNDVTLAFGATLGGYKVLRIPIDPGTHTLSCSEKCGVEVYGLGDDVSYMYAGGLNLERQPQPR